MPTFLPPLSHTSNVSPAADPSKLAYIRLDFHLTLGSGEDTCCHWEIWTNIPSLNEHGELISPHGQWHGIAFSPLPAPSSVKPQTSASSSAITLNAPPKEDLPRDLTVLRGRAIVAPKPGAEFAYTYRRVYPDGGIEWLGGSGSNGVIRILEEGSASIQENAKVSRKSYGLLFESEGQFSPKVISIPSLTPSQIHLALLSTRPETGPGPFSSITHDTDPNAEVTFPSSTYTILIRADFQAFDVDQLIGVDNVLRLTGDTPELAVDAVLPGVPAFAAQVGRADVSVEPSSASDTVTAFFIGTGRNKHLVVWAGAADDVRTLTIKPHLEAFNKPYILFHGQKVPTYLPATEGNISLRLNPGDTAVHVLRSLELDQLAILDKEPLWLAAPQAVSVVPGETAPNDTDIADLLEDDATDDERDEVLSTGRTERTEGVPELDSSDTLPNAEAGAPQSAEASKALSAPGSNQPSPSFLSVLFRLISHLLAGVWEIFFPRHATFMPSAETTVSDDTAAPPADAVSTTADDEADESEAQTPVDERTPLLRSPQIHRAESASTDTMSSTTPPAPPAAKLSDHLPSLDRLMDLVRAPQPTKPSLQYGFSSSPPAMFYFAPQAERGSVLEQVSFQWRNKGSPWAPAAAKQNEMQGGLVQVMVVQGEEQVGGEWEVRVEGK